MHGSMIMASTNRPARSHASKVFFSADTSFGSTKRHGGGDTSPPESNPPFSVNASASSRCCLICQQSFQLS